MNIQYIEAHGDQLWMGLRIKGVRVAEMDQSGNIKLLPTNFLKGQTVTQVHSINETELIAFVYNDKNFYLVEKESGKTTAVANPTED